MGGLSLYDNLMRELQCCPDGEYGCPQCEHRTSLHCRETLMKQAAKAIEELQQMVDASIPKSDAEIIISEVAKAQPKWIPVTERLPNENDDVLIYGEWTGASGTKYWEIWLTDLKGFLHQGYKPIAWMPLPTPPKEEA